MFTFTRFRQVLILSFVENKSEYLVNKVNKVNFSEPSEVGFFFPILISNVQPFPLSFSLPQEHEQ